MATQQQQKAALVASFIDTTAPKFHPLFASPSELNMSTVQYEVSSVQDLRETLQCEKLISKFGTFTNDLISCSWDHVHEELQKARVAAAESESRGERFFKNPVRWIWRGIGATASVLEPGLAAFPDEYGLNVLKGGLALIFSLARHSELNRLKILAAFERLPNIVEIARNKMKAFPLDIGNSKSIELHQKIHKLQTTLLATLPLLIDKLVPGSFRNACKKPFAGWKIDRLLDEVAACTESVRQCSEALVEGIIIGTYEGTQDIKSMMIQLMEQNRMMQLQIDAAAGKTHLLHFLIEGMNANFLMDGDRGDLSEVGSTALPGHTPNDLLVIIDVSHLRAGADAGHVLHRGPAFEVTDNERAAYIIRAPQVKALLGGASSHSIVAVDGHFDHTQMGQISPLSYVCATLAQLLKQQSENTSVAAMSSPVSPQFDKRQPPPPPPARTVVLEYYCSLHIGEDDNLQGPQGLIRCLTAQLILSLLANGWMGPDEAVSLPHLRDHGEEELLEQRDLSAVYRLFIALVRLVPQGVPIYCIIDGISTYERQELWQADYNDVLGTLIKAASISKSHDGRPRLRIILTSPTMSRWLGNFVPPGQKVSLRHRDGGGRNWRGMRGGLMGVARAATMSNTGFVGGGFQSDGYGQFSTGESHSRRTST
ncbi:hypothetical protein B0T26DRAFT_714770 [Lasiosphaeria miniovina]|uniref:Fungal STAND N-terminal Goodbye domain-containing protein n=1 Tax=Lasiosphaeria miniovina TaxID=1954250 RepID=A0AA40ABJ7_9PEZI|nr:uncharacterized protein B0T26DRAFT_714770 [Lasiosphaeria miniovina]KAK0712618.1 hypothetical protein B0T26DRAFT_714770 [Lasiosphaeria miniovina]